MKPVKLSECKRLDLAEGIVAHAVNTDNITVSHVHLQEGSVVPEHSHPHEQIVNVMEGKMRLTLPDGEYVLEPGMAFVLPPNQPHAASAITECRVIDVFHPAREDFC